MSRQSNEFNEGAVIYPPCGSTAYYSHNGFGYICEGCSAIIGSVGEPDECKAAQEKYTVLAAIGSKVRWSWDKGEEYLNE